MSVTMVPDVPTLGVPHRRYDPLLDEWVLCSPTRLERPWQGQTETPAREVLPAYDPECYLCPGNARAGGHVNPPYGATYAFDNDFPALGDLSTGDLNTVDRRPSTVDSDDRLLRAHTEAGVCRVLCFSSRHDLTLARMDERAIRAVVDAWAGEFDALAARPGIRHVQVFENKGAMMGCSNPHPHGQIWATEHVPTAPERRLLSQRRYAEAHGRDLLGDYLGREAALRERVVLDNEHWTLVVPFWAAWPFETLLVPKRQVSDLPSLLPEERDTLAEVIRRLSVRYDNLFRCSFPYSMAWHARPTDEPHPYWRLHASWYPPLLRSAEVRKFVVGYELAAEIQRDVTAEEAAARLRALPDAHYMSQPGVEPDRALKAAAPARRGGAKN